MNYINLQDRKVDTFVIVNLLIMLIILTAGVVDAKKYREEYKSWKSYTWIILFLLMPISIVLIYIYF